MRRRLILALAIAACVGMVFVPPIHQEYFNTDFADQRTILGVPNFFNVVSNLPFLVVAVWGWRRMRRLQDRVFLGAVGLVTFGSAYYHAWPSDATLFWDRLPMALAFLSLLATVIEDRLDKVWGRRLFWPLLIAGAASLIWWRYTGDLRWYGLVQFLPMLVMLLLLRDFGDPLFPLACFYGLAKLLEWKDDAIGTIISTGGHPWKHVAAAAGVFCYVRASCSRPPHYWKRP